MSTRYFLALNGVKGRLAQFDLQGWFEVSGFDIDLVDGGTAAFSPLTLTLGSTRPGVAAGAGGHGEHLERCDAGRRERRGPTGLPPRPRRRVGHERGSTPRRFPKTVRR